MFCIYIFILLRSSQRLCDCMTACMPPKACIYMYTYIHAYVCIHIRRPQLFRLLVSFHFLSHGRCVIDVHAPCKDMHNITWSYCMHQMLLRFTACMQLLSCTASIMLDIANIIMIVIYIQWHTPIQCRLPMTLSSSSEKRHAIMLCIAAFQCEARCEWFTTSVPNMRLNGA